MRGLLVFWNAGKWHFSAAPTVCDPNVTDLHLLQKHFVRFSSLLCSLFENLCPEGSEVFVQKSPRNFPDLGLYTGMLKVMVPLTLP